jgi:hypothetical protein
MNEAAESEPKEDGDEDEEKSSAQGERRTEGRWALAESLPLAASRLIDPPGGGRQ